ncbi:MAG: patatin-like phospholipase family protein, partial [Pseudolabrys sp.]
KVLPPRNPRAGLAGAPPDVTIAPRIKSVGWFDFHRAEDAIRIGEEAAERAIEDIQTAIAALSHPEPVEIAAK